MVETALFGLRDAALLSGGRYRGPENPPPCESVGIDSRTIRSGDLFVPLRGERTDGHGHIVEALNRGAVGTLCREDYYRDNRDRLHEAAGGAAGFIILEDTLRGLWRLSEGYLDRFAGLTRIGVTGSSGKTTTKEILGSIFSLYASTVMNEGNLNSETGLPLSVMKVRQEHRFGIFEMGINHPGEMDVLSRIVKPRAAVITNIGTAHIGLLGSQAAIAAEKGKICAYLGDDGVLFLPEHEPFSHVLTGNLAGNVVTFGRNSTKAVTSVEDRGLDGWELNLYGKTVHFPLIGAFNLQNALCAVSVADYFGLPESAIGDGLERVQPLFGRGQVIRGSVTVLHDYYNANPDSLREALTFFEELEWTGRKIAVLGAMKELGNDTPASHEMIARRAGDSTIDLVFLVGEEFRDAYESVKPRKSGGIEWFGDTEALGGVLQRTAGPGDIVLIKGSRGMALERVTENLA